MWAHQVQHTGLARFQYTRFANSVEIPLPPISVQHSIARVLGAYEDKIALNHGLNQILEQTGKAIFDHWFSEFEFPNEEGKPYKTSDGKMTYNEELEMEIPNGWEAAEFGELIELTMGLSPKGDSYNTVGEGMLLINGAADFSDDSIIPKKFTRQPTRICNTGDLLFCIRGTIGNLTYADKPYCLGRGVAAIATSDRVYQEYVYFVLKQKISFMISQAAGSVIVGLSKPDIMNLRILLAPKIIVSKFHAIVQSMFARKEMNKIETHNLSRIRDSLLPKLMSGKIRTPVEVG
jgi:type I restriction enzyme S subunit